MSDAATARRERLALIALVAGAVGIAFAPIFVRLSEVGPTSTAFWRLALAAPLMAAWGRGRGVRAPRGLRDRLRLCLPGVFFALDLGVWHWSIAFTSVANSTLLANCAPVFVTLGGFVVFRRRFTPLFLLGLVVGLVGVVVLLGSSLDLGGSHPKGDALGLLTAVFYASYLLSVGHLRAEFPTAVIVTWSAAVAAVLLLPVSLAGGEALWPETTRAWLVLLGLAVVSHVGGQGLIAYALAHLPAAFSSVTLLIQPAGATVLAWLLLGERLGGRQAVGAVVILAGILIARRGSYVRRGS